MSRSRRTGSSVTLPPTWAVTAGYARLVTPLIISACLFYWLLGHWAGVDKGFWWAWEIPNTVLSGLGDVWYIFAWALALPGLVALITVIKRIPRTDDPLTLFGRGLWASLHAGVLEEIVWRWLMVLSAPVGLKLLNIITFGLVKWVYTHGLTPLADWATFGLLHPQLSDTNWLAAAAIVSVSMSFRDQHKYLGLFGWINSWYIGMIMFYLVFNHGLITAIVAHVLYDAIIFTIAAVAAHFRPRNALQDLADVIADSLFGRRQR